MAFRAAGFRGAVALLVVGASVSTGCGKASSQQRQGQAAGGEAGGEAADGEGGGWSLAPEGGASGTDAVSGAPAGAAPAGGEPGMGDAGGAPEQAPAPPGLVLRSISISQTIELPLMQAGASVAAAQRPAPLVAGKRALVRAFVDVEPGFVARPLLGVLDVKTSQVTRTLVSERSITQSSLQDDLASSFVFEIAAIDLAPSSSYRLRVLEADTTPVARFPEAGYSELQARALRPFSLVVVPFVSNGFAPKTTDAEITGLRQRLVALLPATDVAISVAPPITLPYVVDADGAGWDNALDRIYQLRAEAAPAHDVFYFGAMAPDASFSNYCARGCILGFSNLAEPADVESRGSIGITVFQDGSGVKDAWDTVAHELGHAMGREHAPCGITDPNDVDPQYPFAQGGLGGLYGFDFDLMRLVKPKPAKDVMSYCTPVWISSYTYAGLFERLEYIESESFRALALAPAQLFRLARIRRDGQSVWLGERSRRGSARTQSLDLLDDRNVRVGSVEAQVVSVDHARGGYVWLPQSVPGKSGAVSVDLRPLGGAVLRF